MEAGSGFPFNITTGVDNNGDGNTSDRPVIDGAVIGRDAGQAPATYDFNFATIVAKRGTKVTVDGMAGEIRILVGTSESVALTGPVNDEANVRRL